MQMLKKETEEERRKLNEKMLSAAEKYKLKAEMLENTSKDRISVMEIEHRQNIEVPCAL